MFNLKKEVVEVIGIGEPDLQNQLKQEELIKEILDYQKVLKKFRLSFGMLIEQCPKDVEEKKYILVVIKTLTESEDLKEILFQRKKIPIKQLEKLASLNKKTIENHNNYIIAMTIILTSNYDYLKDYIKEYWNH